MSVSSYVKNKFSNDTPLDNQDLMDLSVAILGFDSPVFKQSGSGYSTVSLAMERINYFRRNFHSRIPSSLIYRLNLNKDYLHYGITYEDVKNIKKQYKAQEMKEYYFRNLSLFALIFTILSATICIVLQVIFMTTIPLPLAFLLTIGAVFFMLSTGMGNWGFTGVLYDKVRDYRFEWEDGLEFYSINAVDYNFFLRKP